jgi:hypothetical protein
MSRRILQIVTAILSIVPIATGVIGMTGLSDPLYAAMGLPGNGLLDSNLRFFQEFACSRSSLSSLRRIVDQNADHARKARQRAGQPDDQPAIMLIADRRDIPDAAADL